MYSWQNIKRRISNIPAPVGVEVGVHRGNHARLLLKNIHGLTLYMVDAWSPETYTGKNANPGLLHTYGEQWLDNYKAALAVALEFPGRAFPIRGMSLSTARALYGHINFDFAYIDAAHDEMSVNLDVRYWYHTIKPGGWLCGHDYGNPDWPGVRIAVDTLFPDAEIDTDFTWFRRI